MRVVITGAAGNIGREVIEELRERHELFLIDRDAISGVASCVADLGADGTNQGWIKTIWPRSRSWRELFASSDVIVHLAANKESLAPWDKVVPDNFQATWQVIEAAASCRVPRVVFASSNWAVKAEEQRLAPKCYLADGPKISSDVPPSPMTAYGVSKAFGELAGRMFVDEGRLESFVAVRIGSFGLEPPPPGVYRTRWIGGEDIRSLFRCCVEDEFKGFKVVYAVSAQVESPYDLSHTRGLLSWEPRQLP
jgi:NAD+ dependent glucose-6-phosphate dehydrogenase